MRWPRPRGGTPFIERRSDGLCLRTGDFLRSQPPAIPGAYGPQGMDKGGFAGKAMFTHHYSYKSAVSQRHPQRAGFTTAEAHVVDVPKAGHIGTLIVHART